MEKPVIGFNVKVKVYDEDGEIAYQTALLTLDVDDPDEPQLDMRLAGNDSIILNADPEEAWEALQEISMQLGNWKRRVKDMTHA